MAGNGPPRVPTEKLRLRGSWLARERAKTEPKPKAVKCLSTTDISKKAQNKMRMVVRDLAGAGMLVTSDRDTLAHYCDVYAKWHICDQWLESYPGEITDDVYDKMFKRTMNLKDQCLRYAVQLGMTPAARSRVIAIKPEKKSDKPSLDSLKLGV